MRKSTIPVRFLIILSLALPVASFTAGTLARDVVVEKSGGGMNWTQGFVYAHGYGTARPEQTDAQRRLLSRRAAIVDAQRNLLEITKGVRITSVLRADQAMQDSRETATKIEGIVKGARVIHEHYQNEIHTVTMAIPMAGEFLKVTWPEAQRTAWELRSGFPSLTNRIVGMLIPQARAAESAVNSRSGSIVIRSKQEADAYHRLLEWMRQGNVKEVDAVLVEALRNYERQNQYSGLLIDASKIQNFELATIPQIRDEAGNILYPNPQVSYDDIVNKRGVTYDFDLQDAVRNQRVTTTPFTIEALHTYKNLPSDLVIRAEDAARVLQSASTVEAMNKAGVLIVVAI
ncbi:MAG: hypothetical protein WD002_06260 [Pseudomonadales bacterium]